MRPRSDSHQDGVDRTFRTLPARVIGLGLVVVCVVMGVLLTRGEQERDLSVLTPIAVMALVIAIVWVVLLRPCVRLSRTGIHLSNLVTDVDVPYEHVARIGNRWALEVVDTAGRTHSSWAVPARRDYGLRRPIDSYAEATQKGRARESVHAEHVRGHVEHAVQRWQMEGGRTEEGQPARVRWAWSALGPLAATLVFLVVALLAG